MLIDDKIRSLLSDKLHFTKDQIHKLDNNAGLLARTMNLLSMVQRSPNQLEVRQFVQVQLKKIQLSLDAVPYDKNQTLLMARAEYYTFKRAAR